MSRLGEALRHTKQETGLTTKELGAIVNRDKSTISRIMAGDGTEREVAEALEARFPGRGLMLAWEIDSYPEAKAEIERVTRERDALVERVVALERQLSCDVEARPAWDHLRGYTEDHARQIAQILALGRGVKWDDLLAAIRSGVLLARQLELQRSERGTASSDEAVSGTG